MFENPEIPLEDLPNAESVDWLGMDSKFLSRQLTASAIGMVFVIIAVSAVRGIVAVATEGQDLDISFNVLWLLVPLIAIPLFGWPVLSVPRMGYAVRDKDILYKSGVFWKSTTAIPFNRIQHVEKSSTPLDRKFGIANLKLFTAGGTGGDLTIHGLSGDVAEKLRKFILDKVGGSIEQR